MEKRTLTAIVLSSLVLLVYYGVFYKVPQNNPAVAQLPAAVGETSTVGSGVTPSSSSALLNGSTETQPQAPVQSENLQTPLILAEVTSQTGLPLHWWLQGFYQQPDSKGPHTDLLGGKTEPAPLSPLLQVSGTPWTPYFSVEKVGDALVYRATLNGGLEWVQTIKLGERAYTLDVDVQLKNVGTTPQTLAPGLRLTLPQKPQEGKKFLGMGAQPQWITPLYRLANKVKRDNNWNKLTPRTEVEGDITWSGLEDRYFLRAILARSLSPQNRSTYGKQGEFAYAELQYPSQTLMPGQTRQAQFTLYLGPKDPTYLEPFAQAGLDKAIDFGFFGIVAKPILASLKIFHSFLGNWGLAIIFLTIVIKLLLYPLTKKSMASMKGMQQLQPQLKAIREKYKDDRERLNVETMNLFRQHKVNPMGGCLPMLIQMPIYIALYKVLYNATELYHAPFFAFYRDLSAPDPYFILPILMGISFVVQQKMTPSAVDPAQQKMMMLMPIMFTAFMLFLPVGLVLYIFVNNLMTVGQQYMHQHDLSLRDLLGRKKSSA